MEISDSPRKGCSFCKIMFSEISLHDKMMIPEKFARKYRKQLHVRVFLKVPGGAVWPADLVGDGDKVWLQNGWPEFARFYSLSFGHFLVFKYQGNSQFDVFIYDKRGTEIDYPKDSSVPHMEEQRNLNLRQFSKVRKIVAIDFDRLKACKKTRANSACHVGECLMGKMQNQETAEVTSEKALVSSLDDNIQALDTIKSHKDSSREDMATQITRTGLSGGFRLTKPLAIGLQVAASGEKGNHASSSKNVPKAKGKKAGGLYLGGSTSEKGKAKALASAKDFKSKNPSFVLTVRPSFIDGRSRVDIMRSNQNFQVGLQANGKTWPVMCVTYWNMCRFGQGWSQFAHDNSLSIGDVCVFELVNRSQKLLQVFIYRATEC